MSFRKDKNKCDEWLTYKNKMSDLFEVFIIENLALVNQESFEQYLKEGSNKNFHTPINELSDNDFLILEKMVNEWSSFQIGFESFYYERIRRFNRYG